MLSKIGQNSTLALPGFQGKHVLHAGRQPQFGGPDLGQGWAGTPPEEDDSEFFKEAPVDDPVRFDDTSSEPPSRRTVLRHWLAVGGGGGAGLATYLTDTVPQSLSAAAVGVLGYIGIKYFHNRSTQEHKSTVKVIGQDITLTAKGIGQFIRGTASKASNLRK